LRRRDHDDQPAKSYTFMEGTAVHTKQMALIEEE